MEYKSTLCYHALTQLFMYVITINYYKYLVGYVSVINLRRQIINKTCVCLTSHDIHDHDFSRHY